MLNQPYGTQSGCPARTSPGSTSRSTGRWLGRSATGPIPRTGRAKVRAGPLTEDQVLASVFDGAYSVEQARELKRRVKAAVAAVRAGLLVGWAACRDASFGTNFSMRRAGLSRAAREEWSREQRTVRLSPKKMWLRRVARPADGTSSTPQVIEASVEARRAELRAKRLAEVEARRARLQPMMKFISERLKP